MKYSIIGAAKSGTAAALLAKRKGYQVFLSESKLREQISSELLNELESNNIECEFGINSERVLNADCIIVSPGVPPKTQILIEAEKKGLEIISELEFAYSFCKNPIIAITGTNGKTTTTALIEHIFTSNNRKALACGNFGEPLSKFVDKVDEDLVFIVETSSFQLDRIKSFQPNVAIICNITPDHLSYHGSMENYVETKWKISSFQNEKNLLILNYDDSNIMNFINSFKGIPEIQYFSSNPFGEKGIFINNGVLILKDSEQQEEIMSVKKLSLPGIHNAYNSMAAFLAARYFEIPNEDIRDSLMAFKGVEHRLEFVRTLDGIDFINDSKATNINSTWYALQSYNKPLIWIAGGRGDNNDYSLLDELVKNNVRIIIAMGEESNAIFNHYCLDVQCIRVNSMEEAVKISYQVANDNEIVLFSPSCKSFDMFDNYIQRGEVFKHFVNEL